MSRCLLTLCWAEAQVRSNFELGFGNPAPKRLQSRTLTYLHGISRYLKLGGVSNPCGFRFLSTELVTLSGAAEFRKKHFRYVYKSQSSRGGFFFHKDWDKNAGQHTYENMETRYGNIAGPQHTAQFGESVPRYATAAILPVPPMQTLPNYNNLATCTQLTYSQGRKSVNVFHYMADFEGATYGTVAPYSSLTITRQDHIPQYPSVPRLSAPSVPDCPFLALGVNTQTHLEHPRPDDHSSYGPVFPSAASGYQEFIPTVTSHFTPQYTQTFNTTNTMYTYLEGCQPTSGSPSAATRQDPYPQFSYDNFHPAYLETPLASYSLSASSLQHQPGDAAMVVAPTHQRAVGFTANMGRNLDMEGNA